MSAANGNFRGRAANARVRAQKKKVTNNSLLVTLMGKDGDQTYVTELFNLDVIISVGYLVNTATGEKSGTMLAECKWTAGE